MKTQRKSSRNIGNGVSQPQATFDDDGIPNSPFKSSKSAAFTYAMFGVVLGGFLVISGAVMAISHASKTVPTQIVQPVKTATPVSVATADGARKQLHINQTHAATKHVKKHAKAKSGSHAKSL